MKTIGIVAEYNPFHLGHAWQIRESRRRVCVALGECGTVRKELETDVYRNKREDIAVIAVMSGDFVQRGEASVFSKYARAEAACRSGADLVGELPLPWSLSSAEGFARGAVSLLAALGADTLSFGSECAERLPEMEETAALMCNHAFTDKVRERLKSDPAQSFATARQACAEECFGRKLPFMQQPNNILALEYLKAIRMLELPMTPMAVARKGAGHDEAGENAMPSASELRSRLRDGGEIRAYTTPEAAEVFRKEKAAGRTALDRERYERLMLSRLRFLREEDFLRLPDAGDGFGARLYNTVNRELSFEEILASAAMRRCPLARVRRMCVCAALGLGADDQKELPPYARVLAFNEKGRTVLHDIAGQRKNASMKTEEAPSEDLLYPETAAEPDAGRTGEIPLIMKPAYVRRLDSTAQHVFGLGARAHDFYSLLYSEKAVEICGEDWRRNPIIC